MRIFLVLCVVVGVLGGMSGCASNSQVFINPNGDLYKCATSGVGLVSIVQSGMMQEDCIKSIKSAGYLEIEKAGVVGLTMLPMAEGGIKIIKVTPKSPAEIAGILAGDYLVTIDNTPVSTMGEVKELLFNTVGTTVSIKTRREHTELVTNMTRVARSDTFGTK